MIHPPCPLAPPHTRATGTCSRLARWLLGPLCKEATTLMTTVTGPFPDAWPYTKCLRALSHLLRITLRGD